MKKEKNNKKRLSSLVLLLLLTVVMLSTATYAWFTSNRMVRVNAIDVNVQASEGFQISADGITWKSVLTATDLTGVGTTYASHLNHLQTLTMVPVSTAAIKSDADGLLDMYLGTITTDADGDYALYSTKLTETRTTSQYIAFDLFFRTNSNMNLLLEPGAGVKDIATETSRKDRGMENSSRVAFVYQGNVSPTTNPNPTAADVQPLKFSGTDGTNIKIWEPNYKEHTVNSQTEAFQMYGISTTDSIYDSWIQYKGLSGAILEANAVKLPATLTDSSAAFTDMVEANFVKTEPGFTDPEATGMVLAPGVSKYRIYFWLEGQDLDCSDSASGSDIQLNLILSVSKV